MTGLRPRHIVPAATAALALLLLAGCAEEPPPPEPVYAPLHYEYLTRLRLNTGAVDVQDATVPLGPSDVAAQSPVTLVQATTQMLHDRLFAAGLTGSASVVIDQASIIRAPNGVLNGVLALHMTLTDGAGAQVGFAQAHVTSEHIPGSDPENLRTVLYGMTKQMLDRMNVELEYQVRHSLSAYLVSGVTPPAPVTAVPLDAAPMPPPPATPPIAPIAGARVDPAPGEPAESMPGAPPVQMSPPPGYLTLPPGANPSQP